MRFRQDLAGNSLSVLVLFGMVVATVNVTVRLTRSTMPAAPATLQTVPRKQWLVLGLLVVGLAISTYMAFVETTGSVAVCGPVGDCNTVQQSEYARLFGLVPIGLVGIAGYAAMGLLWVPAYRLRKRWARLLLTGLALLGTLFSV